MGNVRKLQTNYSRLGFTPAFGKLDHSVSFRKIKLILAYTLAQYYKTLYGRSLNMVIIS
jgi:hypothetical protein